MMRKSKAIDFNDMGNALHGFSEILADVENLNKRKEKNCFIPEICRADFPEFQDESGAGSFAGSLMVGQPLLNNDLEIDGTFENPRTAEIHLVVRYHGQAVPGMIPDQIRTLDIDNPNAEDVQFAMFPVVP